MSYRKRWRNNWDAVKYCSDRCRRDGVSGDDRALEDRILVLLRRRASGATICPSEVARLHDDENWRSLLEPVRRAARRLAVEGWIVFRQGGRTVDPSTAKGPLRLGRGPEWK